MGSSRDQLVSGPSGAASAEATQQSSRRLVLDLAEVEDGLRQAVDNEERGTAVVMLAARERVLVAELRDRQVPVQPIADSALRPRSVRIKDLGHAGSR